MPSQIRSLIFFLLLSSLVDSNIIYHKHMAKKTLVCKPAEVWHEKCNLDVHEESTPMTEFSTDFRNDIDQIVEALKAPENQATKKKLIEVCQRL
ncbi:hypothetical protein PFISCL1PPCAC_19274 [Pristionchus fissidentatus]|uniref:Uncharacterized protein n=1 Tax=Pristionchus fissidentatus TaxID=1538716 RepID=A0AAV5WAG3_9BILA|nr:hypothetical protein PFISCL1PPCAC_19274 [Pristionchus fissidentatus]